MRYRYEDLGDREFQQLIQALLAHSLGPGLRAMPLGKADGGRDAVHAATVYHPARSQASTFSGCSM